MSESELRAVATELLPCPFCGFAMLVREHSAFHPSNDCWLACAGEFAGPLELDEHDYAAWNRRALLAGPVDEPQQGSPQTAHGEESNHQDLAAPTMPAAVRDFAGRAQPAQANSTIVPSASSPATVQGEPAAEPNAEVSFVLWCGPHTEETRRGYIAGFNNARAIAPTPTTERVERALYVLVKAGLTDYDCDISLEDLARTLAEELV